MFCGENRVWRIFFDAQTQCSFFTFAHFQLSACSFSDKDALALDSLKRRQAKRAMQTAPESTEVMQQAPATAQPRKARQAPSILVPWVPSPLTEEQEALKVAMLQIAKQIGYYYVCQEL